MCVTLLSFGWNSFTTAIQVAATWIKVVKILEDLYLVVDLLLFRDVSYVVAFMVIDRIRENSTWWWILLVAHIGFIHIVQNLHTAFTRFHDFAGMSTRLFECFGRYMWETGLESWAPFSLSRYIVVWTSIDFLWYKILVTDKVLSPYWIRCIWVHVRCLEVFKGVLLMKI